MIKIWLSHLGMELNQDREFRRWTVLGIKSLKRLWHIQVEMPAALYSTYLEPWSLMRSPIS